jgi:hypothetical protein
MEKLNKFNKLKYSETNGNDLLELANLLDLKIDAIIPENEFNTLNNSVENVLLNVGGHWVAVNRKKKIYYDPLGLIRSKYIPKDYSIIDYPIQNIKYGHCGQYSLYALYAIQKNNFYTNFNKVFRIGRNN